MENNALIKLKTWWKRHWTRFVPLGGIALILIGTYFSSGMDDIAIDLAQVYSDTELYENALEIVKSEDRVIELLREILPIDKMSVFEGHVEYSNDNNTVNSTIRINGEKGKAKIDFTANRVKDNWNYSKINVRIKNRLD